METIRVNRHRLLVGDKFVIPNDSDRLLYEVQGSHPDSGLLIRRIKHGWYGYMHLESGVVIGSEVNSPLRELTTIPSVVLMNEADLA